MDEIEQLIAQFNDADMDVRWKAIGASRELHDKRIIGPLLERLSDPVAGVRARAAQALRRAYDERVVPDLLALLHDEEPEVRAAACYGLGGDYYRAALDALVAGLLDREEEVRAAAAEALHHYPSRRALNALLAACHDASAAVRCAVAEALPGFHVPEVTSPLIELAQKDPDRDVRLKAIEGLQYTTEPHEMTFVEIIYPERDVVQQLLALLDDEDELIVMEAIQSLGAIGDERAVNALVAVLFNWSLDMGPRLWAASALGNFTDTRLTPVLIAALQDPHPYIRPVAARSLGEVGDPRALPDLDRVADDEVDKLSEAARKAAEKIRYELSWEEFDRVVQYLAEGNSAEKERAVRCLEYFDDPRARELIIRTLRDARLQNEFLLFAEAVKICARRGEAEALPLLAECAEEWQARKMVGLVEEAEQAAQYIRRKLNGEELEPYRSVISDDDDEEYGLDDEDDEDDEEEVE